MCRGEVLCAPAWETPCEPKLPVVPSRRRCTFLWSTATKVPWKRCHGWGSRSMSFACTPSRSQSPSTSSMSMASSTATSKVHAVPPHALTPVHCPHTTVLSRMVYISVYLDAPEPHTSVFGVRKSGCGQILYSLVLWGSWLSYVLPFTLLMMSVSESSCQVIFLTA